jgi:Mn2+/Fe2+ NRAMP family transporter
MNTPFLMKLSAVVVALFMNSLILGGAAYVVHAQSHPQTGEPSVMCTSKKGIQLHV